MKTIEEISNDPLIREVEYVTAITSKRYTISLYQAQHSDEIEYAIFAPYDELESLVQEKVETISSSDPFDSIFLNVLGYTITADNKHKVTVYSVIIFADSALTDTGTEPESNILDFESFINRSADF